MATWGYDEIIPGIPSQGAQPAANPWWTAPLSSAAGSASSALVGGLMNLLFPPEQPKMPRQQVPLQGAGFNPSAMQQALGRYLGG